MSDLFDVGRLCVKVAGRDAGKRCVILEKIDSVYVLVDGQTRRKKVNTKHLEPLENTIEIAPQASAAVVKVAFAKLGWDTQERKSKTIASKPMQQRTRKVHLEPLVKGAPTPAGTAHSKTDSIKPEKKSVAAKPKKVALSKPSAE